VCCCLSFQKSVAFPLRYTAVHALLGSSCVWVHVS
jgi:hypothetical protein